MKEKVLETLAALGFNAECIDNTGYGFNYEGKHFLFLPNENDDEFLSICLPGIYDYKEDKIGEHCAITEKLNSTLKYVKAYSDADATSDVEAAELYDDTEDDKDE